MIPADEELIAGDLYLERLLAARSAAIAALAVPPGLPAEIAAAARAVRRSLPRFHPPFRFEEELALRIRAAATGSLPPAPVAAAAGPIPFPGAVAPAPGRRPGRGPLLAGGAIASLLSVAGAALLARRRGRDRSPGAA